MDENELLDIILKPILESRLTLREALVKDHLERYDALETEEEQKISIIIFCADCLRNEKEQWAWDVLVELSHQKPINQILLDVFLLPLARGEIKNPKETRRRGRPKQDPFRDTQIAAAVNAARLLNYTLEDAYIAVGRKVHLSPEAVRSLWKKYKNDPAFKRSSKLVKK